MGWWTRRNLADEDSPQEILRSSRERLEIHSALVAAADHRDEVLQVIARAPSDAEAVARLSELLGVTTTGAGSILDMQLRRLMPHQVDRIRAARHEVLDLIARLEAGEHR